MRGVRRALLAILVAASCIPAATAAAVADEPQQGPVLDAAAWILVDARSGEELAARAESRPLPIASATKLMTSYVALQEGKLGQQLTAPGYDALPAESVLGLQEGETISLDNALVAMLLPSANDVAITVAKGLGGTTSRFVGWMNAAAEELGLEDSSFTNPIGLDDPGHLSSARDLATLTMALRRYDRFRKIVEQPEAVVSTSRADRTVVSRNTLLNTDPSVDGVKTGHTLGAGYVLVGSAERNEVPLVSVVLGAPSEAARDAETEQLLDYGYSLYDQRRVVRVDQELASADVAHEDADLGLLAAHGVSVRARKDQASRVAVDAPTEVEGPIMVGDPIGTATVTLDGERIGRVRLLAAHGVAAPSLIDDLGGGGTLVLGLLGIAAVILIGIFLARNRASAQTVSGRTSEERMRHRQRRHRRRRGERRDVGEQ